MLQRVNTLATHASVRGLVILALALSLVLMVGRVLRQSNTVSPSVKGEGECIYQVMRGKSCLGTIRFSEPAHLSAVLKSLSLYLPEQHWLQDPIVPCDSSIDLDGKSLQTCFSPLSAATLVALGGKIDLNAAEIVDLVVIPGVGGKLAGLIVDHRKRNGPFRSFADLEKVPGVGEKKRATMELFLKIVDHSRSQEP